MTYETIFLQNATYYASLHALSSDRKTVYTRAFHAEGDFDEWLTKMETEAREKAASARARLLAEAGGAVQTAEPQSASSQPVTAQGTSVPSAGGIRTKAAAGGGEMGRIGDGMERYN